MTPPSLAVATRLDGWAFSTTGCAHYAYNWPGYPGAKRVIFLIGELTCEKMPWRNFVVEAG